VNGYDDDDDDDDDDDLPNTNVNHSAITLNSDRGVNFLRCVVQCRQTLP
jgi:hypothetical protein